MLPYDDREEIIIANTTIGGSGLVDMTLFRFNTNSVDKEPKRSRRLVVFAL
jgi:hypothetical protein